MLLISTVKYTIYYSYYFILGVWDISNDTLARHDYSGMWKLTLLCGCVQLLGLFFLPLLPSGIKEQVSNNNGNDGNKFDDEWFNNSLKP